MPNSNRLKKLQKDSCEKSYRRKSDRKMEFFIFITGYCVQKFLPYNFFWVHFCAIFSTGSNSASNLTFYDTHIEFLQKTFFFLHLHFLLTVERNGWKKRNT